jgi:hypothetical protein
MMPYRLVPAPNNQSNVIHPMYSLSPVAPFPLSSGGNNGSVVPTTSRLAQPPLTPTPASKTPEVTNHEAKVSYSKV